MTHHSIQRTPAYRIMTGYWDAKLTHSISFAKGAREVTLTTLLDAADFIIETFPGSDKGRMPNRAMASLIKAAEAGGVAERSDATQHVIEMLQDELWI